MTAPAVGDFIYFDESSWGTNFRLQLSYAGTMDQWSRYRHSPMTTYSANGIQVDTSTGVWSDWGGSDPNIVYNEGDTDADGNIVPTGKVRFYDEYDQVHTFTNPYSTSSGGGGGSGSGGGTGTEGTSTGTSTVSGTIVDNSTHYTFTVASTSPSSSGVVAYNVLRDDVLYGTITHTNGATNPMDIHLSDRVSSNWKLTIVSTTGLYQSDTLATFTNIRKGVFCNFW